MRESRLMRHRTRTACTVEVGRPSSPAICAGPNRRRHRSWTIRRTTVGAVRFGIERGRLDRSIIPAGPSVRYRAAHFLAVTGETMNIFAAVVGDQWSSTISLASRRRARTVKAALAWDTKASRFREAVELDSSTSQP